MFVGFRALFTEKTVPIASFPCKFGGFFCFYEGTESTFLKMDDDRR